MAAERIVARGLALSVPVIQGAQFKIWGSAVLDSGLSVCSLEIGVG